MGWVVNATPRLFYTQEIDPVHIVQQTGLAPASLWTRSEHFALSGIRIPDSEFRSEFLYRMSYPDVLLEFMLLSMLLLET
jgi:hypothetical protein